MSCTAGRTEDMYNWPAHSVSASNSASVSHGYHPGLREIANLPESARETLNVSRQQQQARFPAQQAGGAVAAAAIVADRPAQNSVPPHVNSTSGASPRATSNGRH